MDRLGILELGQLLAQRSGQSQKPRRQRGTALNRDQLVAVATVQAQLTGMRVHHRPSAVPHLLFAGADRQYLKVRPGDARQMLEGGEHDFQLRLSLRHLVQVQPIAPSGTDGRAAAGTRREDLHQAAAQNLASGGDLDLDPLAGKGTLHEQRTPLVPADPLAGFGESFDRNFCEDGAAQG